MRWRLAFVLLLAAALRLYGLDHEGLWLDELFSMRAARNDTWGALYAELAADVHPPLYFALLRGWVAAFGDGDAVVRLPSALAGIVTVGLVAVLARRLWGEAATVPAALLYAVAPFAIALEREARGNALFTCFSVAATCLLVDAGPVTRRRVAAYGVLGALLVYTHVFGLFVLAAHAGWLLLEMPGRTEVRRHLQPWLGALVGIGLAFLPWAGTLLDQSRGFGSHPWYAVPSPDSISQLWVDLSGEYVGPAVALLLGIGLLLGRPGDGRGVTLVAAMVAGVVLVPQAVSYGIAPILRDRNVLPLLPVLCAAAGAGFGAIAPRRASWATLAVVAAMSLLVTLRTLFAGPRLEQWREAAALVAQGWKPGDTVWANHPRLWDHYLTGPMAAAAAPTGDALPRALAAPLGRLWVLFGHDEDAPLADAVLAAGSRELDQHLIGARVILVETARHDVALDAAPPVKDAAGLHFYWSLALRSSPLPLSGSCRVGARGRGEPAGGEAARMALRIFGPDGALLDETVVDMPVATGEVWGRPAAVADGGSVEVAFVNDAEVGGEDRNAHLEQVFWECSP